MCISAFSLPRKTGGKFPLVGLRLAAGGVAGKSTNSSCCWREVVFETIAPVGLVLQVRHNVQILFFFFDLVFFHAGNLKQNDSYFFKSETIF